MAKHKIRFEVQAGTGITAYWIAVGKDDVPLLNGAGSIMLEPGKHILIWWTVGNAGSAISIVGKSPSGSTVVEVKQSQVPIGEYQGAGVRKFTVDPQP